HHSDHREPQEVGRDRKHARHGRRQDDDVDLPCVPAHPRIAVASAPGSAADRARAAATQAVPGGTAVEVPLDKDFHELDTQPAGHTTTTTATTNDGPVEG